MIFCPRIFRQFRFLGSAFDIRYCRNVLLIVCFLAVVTGITSPAAALDTENKTLVNNLLLKANQCLNNGDYSCTWAAFESAHRIDPENAGILFSYGYYLSYTGNYTGALEKMDAALAINPENARYWYEKGRVLDKLGRYTESGACFDRATALNPDIQVKATDRFPLNFLVRNGAVIFLVVGFALLATYVYFRERRR